MVLTGGSRRELSPWNPSAVGVQGPGSCLTMLASHLVARGLCPGALCPWQSLAVLPCALCHLLPSLAARGCGLRAALLAWTESCSAGLDPPCHGAQRLPPLAHVLPLSSLLAPWASHSLPRLPALPGGADAGGGAGWPGGARAAGREGVLRERVAGTAHGMLFLATGSPGVLSFTHLFTPGLRGSSWGS